MTDRTRSPRSVLHVAGVLEDRWCGVRNSVVELAGAQRRLGCGVAIHSTVTPSSAPDGPPPEAGVQVFASPVLGPAAVRYSPRAERWAASPEAGGFDVLHQHGIWLALSRMTIRWRKVHGGATVITPHGSLEKVPLTYSRWKKVLALAAYERENLRGASCLHATAEREVEGFRDLGLRNPVAVIPNGVPQPWTRSEGHAERFRAAHGLPARARLLLHLSRIHPKKGLLGLVEALGSVRGRLADWHLVVAGPVQDAAYHDHVRRRAGEEGLADRVHWVGPLFEQDKRDAFAAAELFVLPTLSENFGIVVAEALGAGVPVLTTREALPWRVLEEHGCGWWIPGGGASLADALVEATARPAGELAAMGQRGTALVEERFLWSRVAADTLRLYAWLCGEADRPEFVVLD
jgi:glycosyltransferase involved in cell wall biosynthesis